MMCRAHSRSQGYAGIRSAKVYAGGKDVVARFALIPLTPQDSLVVYHPQPPRRRAPHPSPVRQLGLFELVHTGS